MNRLTKMILEDVQVIRKSTSFADLQGKTILLTGASGLLGTHFLGCMRQAVVEDKIPCKVFGVISQKPSSFVEELSDFSGAELIRGDLSEIDFVRELPKADIILHTAGYGQPFRFLENPLKTMMLNTSTTNLLFEKLNEGGGFLFVSSSEVYIGLENPPFSEQQIGNLNTDHKRACYVEGKRCGETITHIQREMGVNAKIVRLGATYGPGTRLNDQRVISSFIQRAQEGGIHLRDTGEARRAYCYVTDVVECMWNILTRGCAAVYNVGGIEEKSILEIAQIIGNRLHVPIDVSPASDDIDGAPKRAYMDVRKVNQELGKQQYVSLEQGIGQTIEWYDRMRTYDESE